MLELLSDATIEVSQGENELIKQHDKVVVCISSYKGGK